MYKQFIIPTFSAFTWWLIIIVSIWSLVWKGLALWKASKKNDKTWFIALLILNTAGILEILYIFIFSKQTKETAKKLENKKEK